MSLFFKRFNRFCNFEQFKITYDKTRMSDSYFKNNFDLFISDQLLHRNVEERLETSLGLMLNKNKMMNPRHRRHPSDVSKLISY